MHDGVIVRVDWIKSLSVHRLGEAVFSKFSLLNIVGKPNSESLKEITKSKLASMLEVPLAMLDVL